MPWNSTSLLKPSVFKVLRIILLEQGDTKGNENWVNLSGSSFLLFLTYYFMLHVWRTYFLHISCAACARLMPVEARRGHWIPMELELHLFVSYQVGASIQTHVS